MTFEETYRLLKSNTTIKLLTADNAPLVISFLDAAFKQRSRTAIGEKELVPLLEDHLYQINQGEVLYPKTAKAYLTTWTQDGSGFLRKYYNSDDEALFELSPSTETGLKWIGELNTTEFVGTESRLKLLVDILKELSVKSKEDASVRILELEAKKEQLELEIQRAKAGEFDVFDETQIKERFFNATETARRLLSDFRQVEQNFREIDTDFRRKIITTTKVKGKVLDELFDQQDFLWETDQGKSFRAFWEFLMSQSKQQELDALIDDVLALPAVSDLNDETTGIARIKNNLIEAGDKVNRSTGSLIEQLRKFVEHKVFFENKRILGSINDLLKLVSSESFTPKKEAFMEIEGEIKFSFIMDRPLYSPPQKLRFARSELEDGVSANGAVPLFDQFFVDIDELKGRVKTMLRTRSQVSLKEVAAEYGINKGVAELIGYVEIAAKNSRHLHNDSIDEEIIVTNSRTGKDFKVKIPQIIYNR